MLSPSVVRNALATNPVISVVGLPGTGTVSLVQEVALELAPGRVLTASGAHAHDALPGSSPWQPLKALIDKRLQESTAPVIVLIEGMASMSPSDQRHLVDLIEDLRDSGKKAVRVAMAWSVNENTLMRVEVGEYQDLGLPNLVELSTVLVNNGGIGSRLRERREATDPVAVEAQTAQPSAFKL